LDICKGRAITTFPFDSEIDVANLIHIRISNNCCEDCPTTSTAVLHRVARNQTIEGYANGERFRDAYERVQRSLPAGVVSDTLPGKTFMSGKFYPCLLALVWNFHDVHFVSSMTFSSPCVTIDVL